MKKNLVRVILAIFASAMMLLATGCASNGQHLVATAGDPSKLGKPDIRVDRLVTKTSATEGTVMELDVTQVRFNNPDGTPRMIPDGKGGFMPETHVMIKDRTTNPVGNDLVKLATAPAINAFGQYKTGVRVAEEVGKGCTGSSCSGGNQFFVQGGTANSLAASEARVRTNAAVNAALGSCQNGGCATAVPLTVD